MSTALGRSSPIGSLCARRRVLAAGVLLLAGCAASSPVADAAEPIPSGRYAVQWIGYLGGTPDQEALAQFAFIDVLPPGMAARPPDIRAVTLVTSSGDLPTTVDSVTPSTELGAYRLFTVAVTFAGLPVGKTSWDAVRYVDAGGEHEVAVGDWLLEVRPFARSDLVEEAVSVGATAFGQVEATLRNTSRARVVVRGLDFELPGLDVGVSMLDMGAEATAGQDDGAPASGADPVTEVAIGPGAHADIGFTLRARDPRMATFVQLQPFLEYTAGPDGDERWLRLGPQLYAGSFADATAIETYLRQLPAAAFVSADAR